MLRLSIIGGLAVLAGAGSGLLMPWAAPAACPNNVGPSTLTGPAAEFVVINERKSDLVVSWLSPGGYEYVSGTVEPNQTQRWTSYTGVRYVVRTKESACVGVYRVPAAFRFVN
jgi:hypothetical protein